VKTKLRQSQSGITLIVGLILLILITLMVTTAFTLNASNLKSVGNMQFRNEAIAAANRAIEAVIGSSFPSGFVTVPGEQNFSIDNNNDGKTDYTMKVAPPTCVQVLQVASSDNQGNCGGFRSGSLAGCKPDNYNTLWNIDATVTDDISGAQVTVSQGFRQELTQFQKDAVCP
jgi:hypothetical protein